MRWRPDRNRPRVQVTRTDRIELSAALNLRPGWWGSLFTLAVGRRTLHAWFGHDWRKCGCDHCLPF